MNELLPATIFALAVPIVFALQYFLKEADDVLEYIFLMLALILILCFACLWGYSCYLAVTGWIDYFSVI